MDETSHKVEITFKFNFNLLVLLNLEEVEEICQDLHDSKHSDTGSDSGDAGVHVVVGGHLLLLDNEDPFQEVMSLIHLIS